MNDRVTIHDLPEFWQNKVRSLKAENRNLRGRLQLAGNPGDWSQKTQKLVRESRGLRTRLRAAEERIAELEAARDAQ